jgi:hypothetical protein
LSSRRNQYDASCELALIIESTGALPPIPPDTRVLLNHVRLADANLCIKRRQATAARQDFLQELKERIATRKTSNSLPLPQALKIIDKQLESTQRFRRIQQALGNNASQPLTQVEVTTTEEFLDPAAGLRDSRTLIEVINVREELEAAILSRNQRHFAQAKDTPWAHPPLSLISSSNDYNLYTDAQRTWPRNQTPARLLPGNLHRAYYSEGRSTKIPPSMVSPTQFRDLPYRSSQME